MLADLRYSLRNFRKSPGFVAVAVIVLALGIGANTAIFSVVNAALLHALAFPDSGRLVMLWERNPQMGDFLAERMPPCLKNYFAWREQSKSFEAMGVYETVQFVVTGGDKPAIPDLKLNKIWPASRRPASLNQLSGREAGPETGSPARLPAPRGLLRHHATAR